MEDAINNSEKGRIYMHLHEFLVILNYLMSETDEVHLASQQKIIEYGKMFGASIRRQRIPVYLEIAKQITDSYPDLCSYIIEMDESGKRYYLDSKTNLIDKEIKDIVSILKENKKGKELVRPFLDLVSNRYSEKRYVAESDEYDGSKDIGYEEKYKCLKQALKREMTIYVKKSFFGKDENGIYKTQSRSVKCRVYKLKEFNAKTYAILIPIDSNEMIIFDEVSNIVLGKYEKGNMMMEDYKNPKNGLDNLFREKKHSIYQMYSSLDEYLKANIMPNRSFAFKTSFYFDIRYLNKVKESFENFFGINMPVIKCSKFHINKKMVNNYNAINRPYMNDDYAIEVIEDENKEDKWGVVNITINQKAFVEWMLNSKDALKYVTVVYPVDINEKIGSHLCDMIMSYKKYLTPRDIKLLNEIDNNKKVRTIE